MFAVKGAFPRFLQIQSQLAFSLPFVSNYSVKTLSPNMHPDIGRVASFYLGGPDPTKKWFAPPPELDLDNTIRTDFSSLVEKARNSSDLDDWVSSPNGTLALLILLDQFPRNIYRGSPLSYASDAKARSVATIAVATKQERQVPLLHQTFFYLPLMHHESLISQLASVSLYEGLYRRAVETGTEEEQEFLKGGVGYAEVHRDVILRFGRFPSRNACLGRESTEEEIAFLKEKPFGF